MAPQESTALKAVSPATPLYRTAPHNIEAEQALLGAILINNDAFYRVSDFLKPAHFFETVHQKIFDVAANLIRVGKTATPITLKTFLPHDLPQIRRSRERGTDHGQCADGAEGKGRAPNLAGLCRKLQGNSVVFGRSREELEWKHQTERRLRLSGALGQSAESPPRASGPRST